MEKAKLKPSLKDLMKEIFGENKFEVDLTEELKKGHLFETMNKIDKIAESFNTPIHSEGNKPSNGGLSKKIETKGINPETLKKMRQQYRSPKEISREE